MPLAFDSESHGRIAFGFFNIETDLLLLEELFFFARSFCEAVVTLVGSKVEAVSLEGWRIGRRQIGNLHGAIAGQDLSGLIGETYRRYPFPLRPDGFRQNPDGEGTALEMRELVGRFGRAEPLSLARAEGEVRIAEYRFTPRAFSELLAYVEQGGYPRWRDERRPAYVERMMRALSQSVPDSDDA